MAKRSIRSLKAGDKVTLKFWGDKVIGNDPYEASDVFKRFYTEDGVEYAEFEGFSAYMFQNRWRYGSGANVLTVLEVNN